MGKLAAERSYLDDFMPRDQEGLIEELRKANKQHNSKVKESVLSVLKTQAHLTEKVFERQKYSAKEILSRKRHTKIGTSLEDDKRPTSSTSLAEYERQVQMLYKITPQIQAKLDKIKAKNEKQKDKISKPGLFDKLLNCSILGQTLMANPRFYKMNPHVHLPDLCRRCRRPLIETLESRFTSIGILFFLFLPIIGILLLFANREFACVICEEIYVYGDLTARPDEDSDEEAEERR